MYLAIDIGGSKTLIASFTPSGKLVKSVRFETPKEYPDFLKSLEKEFKKLGSDKFEACVAGVPARVDRKHGIARAFGNRDWENVPLLADIEKICQVPTVLENDSKLAGLSEATLIKKAYRKILYITISTGIGGAMVIDGKLHPEYLDMELGQMKFEKNDRIHDWEDIASGRSIVERYGKKASELDDPQAWYAISHDIALGLWNIIAVLTPDVIVIGGGVGTHLDKFDDQLHEALSLNSNALASVPPIRKALRAEEAVIYGCYEFICQNRG